jgi:hypothetical protein
MSAEVAALKVRLLEAIAASRQDGTYEDGVLDQIHASIDALRPHSAIPAPTLEQHRVSGPWRTLFAQFQVRHTAGKPIEHDSDLSIQSFKAFPKLPAKVLVLNQEIHHEGHHYNNVVKVQAPDGHTQGHVIVWGRYRVEEDWPQRYFVDFYQAELRPLPGRDAGAFRAAFGLDADTPLARPLKPPRLHSDIVYCDEKLRINVGSLGGVYVLERLDQQPVSVSMP